MERDKADDFFRGVYQIETVFEGGKAKFPIFYREASSVTALFPASMSGLRRIMPGREFHPLPVLPGVGALAVTAFNYRDTDIGPYNEVSISVPISYGAPPLLPAAGLLAALRRGEFHVYIHHLPVTTKIALDGGVIVYNYPKFLSEIAFEEAGDHVFVKLEQEGRFILSMKVGKLPAGAGRRFRFLTYPVKEGRAQVAPVLFNAGRMGVSFSGGAAELELGGEHPVAVETKKLLLRRRPLQVQYVPEFQAILYGPALLE
ncbi:MAG: acetoacetate decarboxylase family protein [bacterium]